MEEVASFFFGFDMLLFEMRCDDDDFGDDDVDGYSIMCYYVTNKRRNVIANITTMPKAPHEQTIILLSPKSRPLP